MNCGIYEILNTVNGKRYVGSSVCIPKRWREHQKDLALGVHHSKALQRAWDKYGCDSFQFKRIESCEAGLLLTREQHHFDEGCQYNTCKTAGSMLGVSPSQETRRKLSEALRGRIFSDEHKVRISAALVKKKAEGWKQSPESVARGAAKRMGRKATNEQRAKMSAARMGRTSGMKGKKHSEATKEKRREWLIHSNPWRGRKHSEETLLKMRGRKRSEEHCAKLSAAKTGHKLSDEQKHRIRERMLTANPWKGKRHSEKTKEKLRSRIFSSLTRQRMSQSGKKRGQILESTREKMSASHAGMNNAAAISKVFCVQNSDGLIRSGVPFELRQCTGISPPAMSQLISGKQKTAKGWRLVI